MVAASNVHTYYGPPPHYIHTSTPPYRRTPMRLRHVGVWGFWRCSRCAPRPSPHVTRSRFGNGPGELGGVHGGDMLMHVHQDARASHTHTCAAHQHTSAAQRQARTRGASQQQWCTAIAAVSARICACTLHKAPHIDTTCGHMHLASVVRMHPSPVCVYVCGVVSTIRCCWLLS